jgi:hypothetical protein
VLLAHRHLPADALVAAMAKAVQAGAIDPAVVLVEARRLADGKPPAEVIPIGALHRFDRPKPALGGYDALLAHHQPAQLGEHAGDRSQPGAQEVGA